MKAAVAFACVLALSCGKKKEDATPPADPKPVATAPAGKSPVTPDQVAAVGVQQSRLDELGALLDKGDVVAGPVALLDAITKLPEWNALVGKMPKLKSVGDVATSLKDAVTQLHSLKAGLGDASQKLGNLKGVLDKAMADNGVKIDDLKALVGTQLEAALEPLAQQVATTIRKVLGPVSQQLSDTADLMAGTCVIAKATGGKDIQDLCAKSKEAFTLAQTFLTDIKAKPGALYADVTAKLEQQLGALVDTAVKQALDAAQAQVDAALKLPAATGSGSGSAP